MCFFVLYTVRTTIAKQTSRETPENVRALGIATLCLPKQIFLFLTSNVVFSKYKIQRNGIANRFLIYMTVFY